jgi:hypothetical protein
MNMKIGKIVLSCLLASFLMVAGAGTVSAGLNVQLEVISGKVVSIQANQTVTLDDGKVYQSGKKTLKLVGVRVGEVITLKYFVKAETKRVFVEYALGRDSLSRPPKIEQPAPPVPRY